MKKLLLFLALLVVALSAAAFVRPEAPKVGTTLMFDNARETVVDMMPASSIVYCNGYWNGHGCFGDADESFCCAQPHTARSPYTSPCDNHPGPNGYTHQYCFGFAGIPNPTPAGYKIEVPWPDIGMVTYVYDGENWQRVG